MNKNTVEKTLRTTCGHGLPSRLCLLDLSHDTQNILQANISSWILSSTSCVDQRPLQTLLLSSKHGPGNVKVDENLKVPGLSNFCRLSCDFYSILDGFVPSPGFFNLNVDDICRGTCFRLDFCSLLPLSPVDSFCSNSPPFLASGPCQGVELIHQNNTQAVPRIH